MDITPALGVALMGYGARVGRAQAIADRLHARALALDEGAQRCLIAVSADLCLMAPEQALGVRERISMATGVAVPRILVACTHTHSGPDTGLGELLAGKAVPEHVAPILDGIVAAAVQAWERREPARLGWARAEARIGRNRRVVDGPIDPNVEVLRVDALSGRPIAVLFRHSCHGTVRGHDSLELSADWSGAAAAAVESATGAVAVFLLGAHADIDPRRRPETLQLVEFAALADAWRAASAAPAAIACSLRSRAMSSRKSCARKRLSSAARARSRSARSCIRIF